MQERHVDRMQYFKEQGIVTKKYVIPYIEEVKPIDSNSRILEIGCGEGGNLTPFIEMGCEVMGIDLNKGQIARAQQYVHEYYDDTRTQFLAQDIYHVAAEDVGTFDLIMMRDVIEHIPNQDKFMEHLHTFLKDDGVVFFGFPPWTMPFGGHQQICKSKMLSKLPYFHILPKPLYKAIVNAFGEPKGTVDELMDIKATRIGINRFQKLVEKHNYQFLRKTFYLINPNYEIKFGLTPKKQFKLVQSIPYVRDFVTTCMYCVIEQKEKAKY